MATLCWIIALLALAIGFVNAVFSTRQLDMAGLLSDWLWGQVISWGLNVFICFGMFLWYYKGCCGFCCGQQRRLLRGAEKKTAKYPHGLLRARCEHAAKRSLR